MRKPLKLKNPGTVAPANFKTFSEAWDHFLKSWYEPPENPLDVVEIRHAFYAGATYLRGLMGRITALEPGEARAQSVRVFKELTDEWNKQMAAPWTADEPENVPVPETAVPVPKTAVPVAPTTPAAGAQSGTVIEQKPMMWTIPMLHQFQAAAQSARAAGAPTFRFQEYDFRVADAQSIIAHLTEVFSKDLPQPGKGNHQQPSN